MQARIHKQTYTNTYIHTHIHIYIATYIYIHTYIHTYIHIKGKGKVFPLQDWCGPEGGYRYSSTVS